MCYNVIVEKYSQEPDRLTPVGLFALFFNGLAQMAFKAVTVLGFLLPGGG